MTAMQLMHGRKRANHHSATGRLDRMVRRIDATIRDWRRRARERHELAGLDDRMLKDIGITRVEAIHLASKPFWKE